jgi:hypothetical protein
MTNLTGVTSRTDTVGVKVKVPNLRGPMGKEMTDPEAGIASVPDLVILAGSHLDSEMSLQHLEYMLRTHHLGLVGMMMTHQHSREVKAGSSQNTGNGEAQIGQKEVNAVIEETDPIGRNAVTVDLNEETEVKGGTEAPVPDDRKGTIKAGKVLTGLNESPTLITSKLMNGLVVAIH